MIDLLTPKIVPSFTDPAVQGGGAYSPEVLAVQAKMPNALAAGELDKIAAIVDPAVANGTWAQIDFFFCFALTDPSNALTSWVGTKTATGVNNPTHTANQGYAGNGSDMYIDTNINMNTDLTNGSLNDITCATYCYDNRDATANAVLFGTFSSGPLTQFVITQNTGIRYLVNDLTESTWTVGEGAPSFFQDATRYGLDRIDSSNSALYSGGASVDTASITSVGLCTDDLYIMARNNRGTADRFIDATISYFVVGGGINHTNFNNMLGVMETQFSL